MTTEVRHVNEQKTLDAIAERIRHIDPNLPEAKLVAIIEIRNGVPRSICFEAKDRLAI